MVTISWKGTHTESWAWATLHREVGAHAASCGHAALAAKHEEMARKFDWHAASAAKKAAKAVAS